MDLGRWCCVRLFVATVILGIGLVGGFVPLWLDVRKDPRWMRMALAFTGGVLMAGGLIHLLPDAETQLKPFGFDYPVASLAAMSGLLLIILFETISESFNAPNHHHHHSQSHSHLHHSATQCSEQNHIPNQIHAARTNYDTHLQTQYEQQTVFSITEENHNINEKHDHADCNENGKGCHNTSANTTNAYTLQSWQPGASRQMESEMGNQVTNVYHTTTRGVHDRDAVSTTIKLSSSGASPDDHAGNVTVSNGSSRSWCVGLSQESSSPSIASTSFARTVKDNKVHEIAALGSNSVVNDTLIPSRFFSLQGLSTMAVPLISSSSCSFGEVLNESSDRDDERLVYPEYQQGKFVSFFLFLALTFHSLMEGLALGTATKPYLVGVAILAHKAITAFGLGTSLLRENTTCRSYLVQIFMFSIMTPIGVILGIFLCSLIWGLPTKSVGSSYDALDNSLSSLALSSRAFLPNHASQTPLSWTNAQSPPSLTRASTFDAFGPNIALLGTWHSSVDNGFSHLKGGAEDLYQRNVTKHNYDLNQMLPSKVKVDKTHNQEAEQNNTEESHLLTSDTISLWGIIPGICTAIGAGTFLDVALLEVIAPELHQCRTRGCTLKDRWTMLAMLCLGATVMSLLALQV